MSILEVPGAQLAYETRGSGPLLLLIPGATGMAASFTMVAEQLAAHYTVLTYDRRGFSRSHLDGPQDKAHRLETDADDVRRLIEHLGDEPATVFGSSSGAIVALAVVLHHPSVVRTLLPFEPPAMRVLPEGQQWVDFFFQVYALYREAGIERALTLFRERTFVPSDNQVMVHIRGRKHDEQMLANTTYWFEHELRQYPAVDLDLGTLAAYADRIVPLAGHASRGSPCHNVALALGERLGRTVIELPGGHVGHAAQPADVAQALHDTLSELADHV